VLYKPGAPISEAFRALRTSVLMSLADRPPQVILISSAQPKEGKTATSLNLALALVQKGSRVLVVDCDLRRPSLAKLLNVSTSRGISGILTGAYPFDEHAVTAVPRQANLYCLPSGPPPPNPAELLCSAKMEELMKQMRQHFDHIVIDSPPILPVTDSIILARQVDGVVMVVECEATTRAALSRACTLIENSGGRVLGTVFNKVDANRDGYYGYRYYHGYYSYHNSSYYAERTRSTGT